MLYNILRPVGGEGENSPQLTKIPVSQKIITNSNDLNTVVEVSSRINPRICDKLLSRPKASDFFIR